MEEFARYEALGGDPLSSDMLKKAKAAKTAAKRQRESEYALERHDARQAAQHQTLAAELRRAEAELEEAAAMAMAATTAVAAAAAPAAAAAELAAPPASFDEVVAALAPEAAGGAAARAPYARRERTAERAALAEALRVRLGGWSAAAAQEERGEGREEQEGGEVGGGCTGRAPSAAETVVRMFVEARPG